MTEEPTDEEVMEWMEKLGISDDPQGAEGIGDFMFLILMSEKSKEKSDGNQTKTTPA